MTTTQKGREGAVACALFGWLLSAGCGGEPEPRAVPLNDPCAGLADRVLCTAGLALSCIGGVARERTDCTTRSLQCAEGLGCRFCQPSATMCDGAKRFRCNAAGTAYELVEECASGLSCAPAGCRDLCKLAEEERSYLGCDYWPAFTSNSKLNPRFLPAVAIGNGNLVAAHVVITRGESRLEVEIPPRSSQTVELAYDETLARTPRSLLVRQAAYRLRASIPVTVHQFNPLYFQLPGECDDAQQGDGVCNSFTNDASLLLPTSALMPDESGADATISYLVASYPSHVSKSEGVPGTVAVVAMGELPIRVHVVSSAHTLSSPDVTAVDAIEALQPGAVLERTLSPGDVLQLASGVPAVCAGAMESVYCDPGPSFDLTGTLIQADGPIAVIGGHDCTFVPFGRRFCDHLEESLPPLRTWGTTAVVTRPRAPGGAGSRVRVISAVDANAVSFDPPVREPVVLSRGQFVEFDAMEPFLVHGSAPLLVAQYLLGQGPVNNVGGDPSMSIAVPVDQYRRSYNFISPATYSQNFVDVIAAEGQVVRLDGKVVTGFVPIGSSGFATATVSLSKPGAHELVGERGLGVVLYGFALYTSYMLPGGLDLRPIAGPDF